MIEAILAAVRDIDDFDDLGLQAVVKHVRLVEIVFEVCRSCEDQAGDVHFVLGDVVLHGKFGDFAHVVVALLFSQTGESKGGLATSAVLLGKVHGELMDHVSGITAKRSEESAVSVHDDKAKFLVGFK